MYGRLFPAVLFCFLVRLKNTAWEKVISTPKSNYFSCDLSLSRGQRVCVISINVCSRSPLDCYHRYGIVHLQLEIENFMVYDVIGKKVGGG